MLHTTTLFSFWYWLLAMALWSQLCSSSYGVPARILQRAARGEAEHMALVDRMARAFAAEVDAGWRRWGALATAGASAGLAALATLAFAGGLDIALGLLLLGAPMCGLAGFAVREALLVHAHQPPPAVVLEVAIIRRRIAISTAIAALSISFLAMVLRGPGRLSAFVPF